MCKISDSFNRKETGGKKTGSNGRLPLTIVSGFLGAGKSTWLRHQLHEGCFSHSYVVVNEAADIPVDNLLLHKAEHVTLLTGGCGCCQNREALRDILRHLCQLYDEARQSLTSSSNYNDEQFPLAQNVPASFAQIVLETSGLASPGNIAALIEQDPLLVRRLTIDNVIVLLDAVHGRAQLETETLVRTQIEAATRLVITKASNLAEQELARLGASLRQLNPIAEIEAAEFGENFALPSFSNALPFILPRLSSTDIPITSLCLDIREGGGDWAGLSVWLSALLAARGDDIIRVKGVVATPTGRLLLQSVRHIVQPPEILPEIDLTRDMTRDPATHGSASIDAATDDHLILLGRGLDEARIRHSWRRFTLS